MKLRPKKHPVPYHSGLDTKLMSFGKHSHFTIRHAIGGSWCIGGTGSGKTSGVLSHYAKALLLSGAGGLVCCVKPGEADRWLKLCRDAGRLDDVMVMNEDAETRFNMVRNVSETTGRDGWDPNVTDFYMEFGDASDRSEGSGGTDSQPYFRKMAKKWISDTLPILRVVYGKIDTEELYQMVVTAPQSYKDLHSEEWLEKFCGRTLTTLSEREKQGHPRATEVINQHTDFYLKELPGLGERTRGAVSSTLTNILYPWLSGKLHKIFATQSSWSPLMSRSGAILICDLPTLKYGSVASAMQSVLISQFGAALQAEEIDLDNARLSFIFADEAQELIAPSTSDLLSTARSSKIAVVLATQDVSTIYSKLGAKHHDDADALLNKASNKFMLSNTSETTNAFAANLIGKTTRFNESRSVSHGSNTGGGLSQAEQTNTSGGDGRNQGKTHSYSSYQGYVVEPDEFACLKTGGPANKGVVEAYLIRNGYTHAKTGRHWEKVSFKQ